MFCGSEDNRLTRVLKGSLLNINFCHIHRNIFNHEAHEGHEDLKKLIKFFFEFFVIFVVLGSVYSDLFWAQHSFCNGCLLWNCMN